MTRTPCGAARLPAIAIVLTAVVVPAAHAQMQQSHQVIASVSAVQDPFAWAPCCRPNLELADQLRSGELADLGFTDLSGDVPESNGCYSAFTNSYLPPSGTAPREPDLSAISDTEERAQAASAFGDAYLAWACRYAPKQAFDGDTTTAWVEGADGAGIGTVLVVPIDGPGLGSVQIWAGYGKSDALFRTNARPRDVRVYMIEVGNVVAGAFDGMYRGGVSGAFMDLGIVDVRDVTLQDVNGYQPLPLPDRAYDPNAEYLIGVELLSVYPGTRYEDTCITEINLSP